MTFAGTPLNEDALCDTMRGDSLGATERTPCVTEGTHSGDAVVGRQR